MYVGLNNKYTFCLYNFKFPDKCFGFRLELVDEFTKIFQSALGCLFLLYCSYRAIGPMDRVFANGLGDQGSVSGRVIQKTQKNGTWCCLA